MVILVMVIKNTVYTLTHPYQLFSFEIKHIIADLDIIPSNGLVLDGWHVVWNEPNLLFPSVLYNIIIYVSKKYIFDKLIDYHNAHSFPLNYKIYVALVVLL